MHVVLINSKCLMGSQPTNGDVRTHTITLQVLLIGVFCQLHDDGSYVTGMFTGCGQPQTGRFVHCPLVPHVAVVEPPVNPVAHCSI
jgi:hypothetical protein